MNGACLQIRPDGSVACLWTDALPIAEIGQMTVRRASVIEFNPGTQEWEVRLMGQRAVAYSNASRAACIGWEIATLNNQLKDGNEI